MWVISKKKALFTKDEIAEHPKTHESMQVIQEQFVLEPNIADLTEPVYAPDWIKETEFYKLLRKEGSIKESADPPKGATADESEDEQDKHHKGQTQSKTGLPAWSEKKK